MARFSDLLESSNSSWSQRRKKKRLVASTRELDSPATGLWENPIEPQHRSDVWLRRLHLLLSRLKRYHARRSPSVGSASPVRGSVGDRTELFPASPNPSCPRRMKAETGRCSASTQHLELSLAALYKPLQHSDEVVRGVKPTQGKVYELSTHSQSSAGHTLYRFSASTLPSQPCSC